MSSQPLWPCSLKASRIMSAAACEVSWRKHCPFSSQITASTGSPSSPRAKFCKWYRVIWYSHFIICASFLLASCPHLGNSFFRARPSDCREDSTLPNAVENQRSPKGRCFSQVLFNPEKLVVFGHPVATAGRTRFDLPYLGGHCQV